MPACARCSSEIPAGSRFCSSCGAPAGDSSHSLTVTVGQGAAARLSTTTTPDEGRLPPGTVIAQRYRIAARLGKGGMGEVYKAADLLLGQTVAIKFLPEGILADEGMLDRFRNEVRLARQVSHPNVCRVYDIGEADGQMFLTMEYIDGEDLASLLRRIGQLPPAKGLETARRLCAGLAAAHEKGVMHRDLKPANIMIDGRGQLLITDFGLAAVAGAVEGTDVRSGTTAYMSPEQLSGLEVTHRSDIYALGLVLYEIFAGKPPFQATTIGELRDMQRAGAPPLSESVKDIDPATERAVARCLEPDPRKRPPAALAVAAALPGGDPLAAALSAGETPSPEMVAAAGEREGLKPAWAIACLGALIASLFGLAWIADHSTVAGVVRLELPPQAMAQKARDVLAGLGYTDKPLSAAWDYSYDYGSLNRIPRNSGREAAAKAVAERPPLMYFMYRSSPAVMSPKRFGGRVVRDDDPPQTEPGMINLRLDSEGRLIALSVKPASKMEPAAAVDWTKLFQAAGLDIARFTPAEPEAVPPFTCDQRQAWIETGAKAPLRLEAAAWRGRPVFFRMERKQDAPRRSDGGNRAGTIVSGAVLAGICILAWRNARLGRGDRRGAARAAYAIFLVYFVSMMMQLPHAFGTGEMDRLLDAAGYALLGAAVFGLIYVALEPHVRRRWPHALIAWTRLLGGAWRDPLVASHILIGLTAGAVQLLFLQGYFAARGDYTSAPTLVFANGPLRMAGQMLQASMSALIDAGFMFFVLFFTYRLIGKRLLAVIAATLLFAIPAVLSSSNMYESAAINLLLLGTVYAMIMRYGLLATVAMRLPFTLDLPITLDGSLWYWGASLAALAGVAALGSWAFRTSLGGQAVFKSE